MDQKRKIYITVFSIGFGGIGIMLGTIYYIQKREEKALLKFWRTLLKRVSPVYYKMSMVSKSIVIPKLEELGKIENIENLNFNEKCLVQGTLMSSEYKFGESIKRIQEEAYKEFQIDEKKFLRFITKIRKNDTYNEVRRFNELTNMLFTSEYPDMVITDEEIEFLDFEKIQKIFEKSEILFITDFLEKLESMLYEGVEISSNNAEFLEILKFTGYKKLEILETLLIENKYYDTNVVDVVDHHPLFVVLAEIKKMKIEGNSVSSQCNQIFFQVLNLVQQDTLVRVDQLEEFEDQISSIIVY